MKRTVICTILAFAFCFLMKAQAPSSYQVITPDYSRSMDAAATTKKVLKSHDTGLSTVLYHATLTGKRAQGPADDPDYATYGDCVQTLTLSQPEKGYNRLHFRVLPECKGAKRLSINLQIDNKVSHYINLTAGQWNDCYLEIDEFDTEEIKTLTFSSAIKGPVFKETDSLKYTIKDITFEKVANPERTSGWQPQKNSISYSTSGYLPWSTKIAIVGNSLAWWPRKFKVLREGTVVYKAKIKKEKTSTGKFGVLDFSSIKEEGEYVLQIGKVKTHPFLISNTLWESAQKNLVNYIFGQRCGTSVADVHDNCHHDLFADHDGKSISYGGGWHDAGDLSQQTLQTGETAFSLLEAYTSLKDSNPQLADRLLSEAKWGLDFIQHCRFGDGFRASSMGLLHWTDNTVGTYDDIHTVRVQNNAFDNFLYAAYEAYAAMSIDDQRESLTKVAKEDFNFALEKFRKDGFDIFPHIMEHSYNSSESLCMAAASWSASMLYRLTGDSTYSSLAAEFIDFVIECQQAEPLSDGTCGFFYRNTDHHTPVHFIHQSRDQLFAQALSLICLTQPDSPAHEKWLNSLRIYGDYLKGLMKWTAPYAMVPSGVYKIDEYEDEYSFNHLHIFAPEDAKDRFVTQLHKGVRIDDEYYIRRFPAWFNIYNGNNAIILSTGKAAALCGKVLKDNDLLQIGLEQLYWTVGKNPFNQSMIFGEGWNYPQMNSFSSGELTGEIPVGIRSIDDEDSPYFPNANNACYKEVWVSSAARALSLIAEF